MSIRPKNTDALLFLDETGTSDYFDPLVLAGQKALIAAGKRPTRSTVFGLAGVLIRRKDYKRFAADMKSLRKKHFGNDAFLLHEYDLRHMKKAPFTVLRAQPNWEAFYRDLEAIVRRTDFRVIVATIDKIAMQDQYVHPMVPYHPYQYSLHVIIERVINEKAFGTTCRVVAENRQAGLNTELINEMAKLHFSGGSVDGKPTVSAAEVQARIDPTIIFRTKRDLDAGLEIADLAAGPVMRWLHGLKGSHARDISPIILPKLRRSGAGKVRGYGAICLPFFPIGCPA